MALAKGEVKRKFVLDSKNVKTVLEDPNVNLSVEQVREIYTAQYPELVNSKIVQNGLVDGVLSYEFATVVGTKG